MEKRKIYVMINNNSKIRIRPQEPKTQNAVRKGDVFE